MFIILQCSCAKMETCQEMLQNIMKVNVKIFYPSYGQLLFLYNVSTKSTKINKNEKQQPEKGHKMCWLSEPVFSSSAQLLYFSHCLGWSWVDHN